MSGKFALIIGNTEYIDPSDATHPACKDRKEYLAN